SHRARRRSQTHPVRPKRPDRQISTQAHTMKEILATRRAAGQSLQPAARRASCISILLALSAVLAACAGGPRDNITLIPADQIEQERSKDGLFTQPIKYKHSKPDCNGECPQTEVDSLFLPALPILTVLVDHAMAVMSRDSTDQPQPYDTIAEYEEYFWKTPAPRD